jgi:predicted transcriptional regulator
VVGADPKARRLVSVRMSAQGVFALDEVARLTGRVRSQVVRDMLAEACARELNRLGRVL